MSNRGSLAEGIIGNSLGKENAGWPSGLKGAGFQYGYPCSNPALTTSWCCSG